MKVPTWLKAISRRAARRPATPPDIAGLARKFGTNPAYTAHYWNHLQKTHRAHPLFDLYLESELGGLNRSREHIRLLSHYFHDRNLIRGRECLDIGCSSGHALVAFREQGARKAVGIDVDEDRLATAALNIGGCPATIREEIQVLKAGIEKVGPEQLGCFDIIFCNDVLEHVADWEAAIRQIGRLLKTDPAAFAFVNLHNSNHPHNVLHEPHYDMPGLIVLPRDMAEQLFLLFRTDGCQPYEVNRWTSFAECRDRFSGQGRDCALFPATTTGDAEIDELLCLAGQIRPRFDDCCRSANVPASLREQAGELIDGYLHDLSAAARVARSGGSPEAREALCHRFGTRVLNMIVTGKKDGPAS